MNKYSVWNLVKSDYRKVRSTVSIGSIITALLFNESFKRILIFRLLQRFRKNILFFPVLFILNKLASSHYGVYIDERARIGKGLNIVHCFSIIITDCVIGDNVTIMHQTTIGKSRGGNRAGSPIIGDNVFIGAGAKIIGRVKIGKNVAIGANAVVTKDVPDGCVIAGIPARIIGHNGKEMASVWTNDMY